MKIHRHTLSAIHPYLYSSGNYHFGPNIFRQTRQNWHCIYRWLVLAANHSFDNSVHDFCIKGMVNNFSSDIPVLSLLQLLATSVKSVGRSAGQGGKNCGAFSESIQNQWLIATEVCPSLNLEIGIRGPKRGFRNPDQGKRDPERETRGNFSLSY